MNKRSAGEKFAARTIPYYFVAMRKSTAKKYDAAIRRAQADAWDECYVRICESDLVLCADLKVPRDANPYRGRKK